MACNFPGRSWDTEIGGWKGLTRPLRDWLRGLKVTLGCPGSLLHFSQQRLQRVILSIVFHINLPNSEWFQMKVSILHYCKEQSKGESLGFWRMIIRHYFRSILGQDFANAIISNQLVSCIIDGLRDMAIARNN